MQEIHPFQNKLAFLLYSFLIDDHILIVRHDLSPIYTVLTIDLCSNCSFQSTTLSLYRRTEEFLVSSHIFQQSRALIMLHLISIIRVLSLNECAVTVLIMNWLADILLSGVLSFLAYHSSICEDIAEGIKEILNSRCPTNMLGILLKKIHFW